MPTFCRKGRGSDVQIDVWGYSKKPDCTLDYAGVTFPCRSRWVLLEYANKLKAQSVAIPDVSLENLLTYAQRYEPR